MIESLKDLEKLLKLCRRQGVLEFEHKGTKIKLGDLPAEIGEAVESSGNPYEGFPTGELSPDQLLFYSSGGRPEDDPALKDKAS